MKISVSGYQLTLWILADVRNCPFGRKKLTYKN